MERCGECGYGYDLDRYGEAGCLIVDGAAELAALLQGDDGRPAIRRAVTVWSPLEYGCHLRDVLLVQRERVLHARRTHQPSCVPMGRDERVEHDGYADQDPGNVARQLMDAARMFARVLDRLGAADWERTLIYNYPQPSERPLRWVAVHTLHEVRHHLLDVRRQLE